ncbi:TPR-like protein [Dioscorea alata]|uniref:TPR-like protein n=1 Tax=Dioscorea alata TaxID=55571 RepID=A0ACB7WQK6_DIOAL|nr:TPR-like protein [Dioscorea alata]
MPLRNLASLCTKISGSSPSIPPSNHSLLLKFKRKIENTLELCHNSFVQVLRACAQFKGIGIGKQVHSLALKHGFQTNVFIGTALLDLYSKCGLPKDARLLFDEMSLRDLVSWNVMLSCNAVHGLVREAFQVFNAMRIDGFLWDEFTFSSFISCCCGDTKLGKQIHGLALILSLDSDVFVSCALVDNYMKSGDFKDAHKVFNEMLHCNTVSWNSIIIGYAMHGDSKNAMRVLTQMIQQGFRPDDRTLASVLSSCANQPAANEAAQVHNHSIKTGLDNHLSVSNALIFSYAKSGNILYASQVFQSIHKPDIVSFSSMISSYAFHGFGKEAIDTFEKMLKHGGIWPDKVVFLGVLSACSHAGLVEKGRAGYIDEAHDVVVNMPFEPDGDVLGALIGACKLHGNACLGKLVGDKLHELEPCKSVNYKLMSNIYVGLERWDEAVKVRRELERLGCDCMVAGCSWM